MSWVEKNRKINNRLGGDDYSGLESRSVTFLVIIREAVFGDYVLEFS